MGGYRDKRGFKSPYTSLSLPNPNPDLNRSPQTCTSKVKGENGHGRLQERVTRSSAHHHPITPPPADLPALPGGGIVNNSGVKAQPEPPTVEWEQLPRCLLQLTL